MIVDPLGYLIRVNDSLLRMLCYTRQEIIGKHSSELVSKEEKYAQVSKTMIAKLFEDGFITAAQAQWVKKDGSSFPIEVSMALLKDPSGNSIGGVASIRDITDRIRDQEELKKAYDELEQRVIERTAELQTSNEQLQREIAERKLGEQLEAAARQKEALRKERDALQKQLAAEKDRVKAEETRKKLDTVLAGEESIDETNLLWARLAPQIDFYSGGAGGRQRISPADLDESLAALQKAVQTDPRNVRGRMLLASIYQQKNNHAAAEKELRFALERAPNNPFLHMQLGIVLREQGNYLEALREFRIIEHKQPNQPQMLYQTALTHMANGNCRLAVGYSKRFLLYTRKNDRPAIAKLKPKVQAVIDECGDQPVPTKRQRAT